MKKHILITGSTDGIGKLAAIKLAQNGHHVYLHGRNAHKLVELVSEVKAETQNENVNGFVADLSDLDAVRQMALEVKEGIVRLDVLINNAGIFQSSQSNTKHGIDIRLVVNYLAPYLLTHKLVSMLGNSEGSRIINLSSAAQDTVSIQALQGKRELAAQEAYAQSKLALTMWSFDLAKKLKNPSVIALNPGSLLNTKMVQEAYGRYCSSADKGANIIYDLAVSPEYEGIRGKYFDNDLGETKGNFSTAHPDAYEEDKIKELITTTNKILGL